MADMGGSDSQEPGVGDIQIGVLGPVVGSRSGEALRLGGSKQLCVLASLIVASPGILTADDLALIVYGEDAPERGRRRAQTYVSTLRSMLGDSIERRGDGWVFVTNDLTVDAIEFEKMISRCDGLRADAASALLTEALTLWRGVPFSGIESHGYLDADITRLEELRMLAIEKRIDADLELGKAADLVPELGALIAEHPYREGLRSRHIIALYRCGRQKDALASFQELRELLLNDLGVDPSPELRALEARILQQDPDLEARKEPDGEPLRGYRLLEQVGSGTFSVVWRGIQPTVDRPVAVKQIRTELASRPAFIRSFEKEALVVARIEHPHIVPLIDYWRDTQGAYLVMRWLRGGTVQQSLLDGPWTVERTLKMAHQIGEALHYAHERGVTHRDITTDNIMLDESGNAFLGDFGIAVEALASETGDGTSLPHSAVYASPEQLRDEPLDLRADIFSFAVVIYECLAGSPPFSSTRGDAQLIRRQLSEPYPRLTEVVPEVADHIADAISRATSKSANERFDSVLDFVHALGDASAELAPIGSESVSEVSNPYKGLRTFEEPDADDFFGRARLIEELIDALSGSTARSRCVTLVGPSGSGKSSVVLAGLLPALRAGRAPGSSDWYVTTMVPGADPFKALEEALVRIATRPPVTLLHELRSGADGVLEGVRRCLPGGQGTILVVIDQLEELFSTAPADRADAFLTAIATAANDADSPLRVVTTLRADYYDRPLRHQVFADVLKEGSVDVTPLAADEVEAAIVQPARRRGINFEPGLAARIAADTHGQPGSLPLLQHALADLFEQRDAKTLTIDAYEESGGLVGALAARADDLYRRGSPDEQDATRRIFGRLVDPASLGNPDHSLRRRVLRRDLGDDTETTRVVERFAAARLLTFDRDPTTRAQTVEVAHEALLREWPRLTGWLEDDRALLVSLDHLGRSADAWHDGGRSAADLYRGARLIAAREAIAAGAEQIRAIDREFMTESLAEAEAERMAEVQRTRRLKQLVAVIGAALIVAVLAGAVALQQRGRASEQAVESSARGLAAQAASQAERNLDTALLLAANGAAQSLSADTQAGLLSVLEAAAQLESTETYPGPDGVEQVVFGAGGIGVSLHSSDSTIRSIDLATGEPVGPAIDVDYQGGHPDLSVSGDGTTVTALQSDGYGAWDLATGELLVSGVASERDTVNLRISHGASYMTSFDFSTGIYEVYSILEDRVIGQLNSDGLPIEGWPIVSADETTLYLAGTERQLGGQTQYLTYSLPELTQVSGPTSLDFTAHVALPNADQTVVALATWFEDTGVSLVDPESLAPIAPTTSLNAGRLASIEWNPSSTRLLVSTLTGELIVLTADGVIEGRFIGRDSMPTGVGWLDDDRFAAVYNDTMMTFNLAATPQLTSLAAEPPPDGLPAGFADAHRDGTVVVNRVTSMAVVAPSGDVTEFPLTPAISEGCLPVETQPFGSLVVMLCFVPLPDGGQTAGYAVVDSARGEVVHDPIAVQPGFGIDDIIANNDGDVIAIGGIDQVNRTSLIQLVDAATGDVIVERAGIDRFAVLGLAWTPDEDLLLATGQDGDLKFLDPETLDVQEALPLSDQATKDIAFDAEGETVIIATEGGEVWRVDLASRTVVGEPFIGAASQFQEADVSPDGSRIAATGRDGRIRVWDVESGTIVGTPLSGGNAERIRFVDNDTIITSRFFGDALIWDLSAENLIETACQLAGRQLSDDELDRFSSTLDSDVCAR